ncbi:MAG: LysM peptidoglycan-binding domain-containing protein [Acidobacteria bacterium]|jgi:LysM repeat protein|nr:LysM peptidoglycan-binding domain-containing protein [Acidobacteriota bacterium]
MSGSKIGFNFQTTNNLNLAQKMLSKEQSVSQDKVPQTDEYIVKRGDTLTEIAVKTGQNLQELLQKNQQIKNPNRIYVGQRIEIGKTSNIYTVKPGDTLSEIAKAKHTTAGDLLRANPKQIGNRNLIYPGQKLIIPTGVNQSVPTDRKTPPIDKPTQPVPHKPIETTPPQVENKPKIEQPNVNNQQPKVVTTGNLKIAQINLDDFLSPEKGSNAGYAILIGNAEGNRTPEGYFRPSYYGHRDPGDGKWNIGSFSYSNERGGAQKAKSPEDADRIQLGRLYKNKDVYAAAMNKAGLDPNNALLATVYLDMYNQSPTSAELLLKPENLKYLKENGVTIETMKEWRYRGFINPETGKQRINGRGKSAGGNLASGDLRDGYAGLANRTALKKYNRSATEDELKALIRRDQNRRVDAMIQPLKDIGLLSIENQTATQKPVGDKRPQLETSPTAGTVSNKGEIPKSEINIPHIKLKPVNDIRLSPQVAVRLGKIAADYYQATGKNLTITDGNRTPLEQGFMMIKQIRIRKLGIYRRKDAAMEIKQAYDNAVAQRKSDKQIAQDIAVVIKEQINKGVYISPHLRNNAADVRFSDMEAGDRAKFIQIVNKYGGEVVTEKDHFHVQWR